MLTRARERAHTHTHMFTRAHTHTHTHTYTHRALSRALDTLATACKAGRSTDPATFREIMQRLGAIYMALLPRADPLRAVSLLHSFAHLGVNPGGDQEGLKVS